MLPKTPRDRAPRPGTTAARGWREREWLWLAGTLGLLGLLFTLWPTLALTVSGRFYRPPGSPGCQGSAGAPYPLTPLTTPQKLPPKNPPRRLKHLQSFHPAQPPL